VAPVDQHGSARVLVTGATGFVGRALCAKLAELGYAVRRAVRTPPAEPGRDRFDTIVTGELGPDTDWSRALQGVSVVYHLAARTHVLRETASDALAEYRRINVGGTRALAQAALRAGARRMIFLSSIKVTGECTEGHPFTEDTPPQPEDAYGISKWEAEQALCAVAGGTGLDTMILRPPLVYGPGVKGNFFRLMRWVARGVPLPLASVTNCRSLVYVENLVDAIITAGNTQTAARKIYLVSDHEDVSTPQLIRSIAAALQVSPRLFPCPPALLTTSAAALGKGEEMRRLIGSLQIDSARIRHELHWNPRFRLAQGLAQTAQWYHSQFPSKSNT
jgi:nucleoside-diphosphate-sugar epimerase